MRTILLTLAAVLLVAAAPTRAEFDAAGVASAKPKATQASGAAFDNGVAANPRATGQSLVVKANARIRIRIAGVLIIGCPGIEPPVPLPGIKNPSNIPRPKHPKLPEIGAY
jgi:hypothetical protein